MRHKGYQSRTLVGLDGPITLRRARYRCNKTGTFVFPLDEQLDIPPGEVTVSLARRSLRLGTKMAFGELQEELLEQHDVRLSDSTLDTLLHKAGGVARQDRQEALDVLAQAPLGRTREEKVKVQGKAPKRMYVSCDGITYRTRLREDDPEHPGEKRIIHQEMKVGCVYWEDDKGKWHKRATAGRENPERFGLSLWQVAVECGMLTCPEVVFLSDGGSWCQSVAHGYFTDALRILDWYHLTEHVWKAGGALYPEDDKAQARWVHGCLDHLHDSSGIGLQRRLDRCQTRRKGKDALALEELSGYLRPRLAITDYVEYRARGMQIGSGMMESTCKQVVSQRMKGPGMQWSERGALAMASLVTHRLNGSWNDFWATRPLQRAA